MRSKAGSLILILSLVSSFQISWAAASGHLQTVATAKPLPKKESPFGGGVEYSFKSDQNQITSKKTSKHELGLSGEYSFSEAFKTSAETSVQWQAEGNNVQKKEDNPNWQDLEIGLSYTGQPFQNLKATVAVSDSLPTGYESRTEGVRNTIGLSGNLARTFFANKFVVTGGGSGSYIGQTYDYSITSGESNPDSFYTGTLAMSYQIIGGLKLGAKYVLWTFHMINGENNLARNQSILSISYSTKMFRSFIGYSVGNYDKSDGYKFLFVDDTRQILSVGVGFEI
jgi:hypothetical protein